MSLTRVRLVNGKPGNLTRVHAEENIKEPRAENKDIQITLWRSFTVRRKTSQMDCD